MELPQRLPLMVDLKDTLPEMGKNQNTSKLKLFVVLMRQFTITPMSKMPEIIGIMIMLWESQDWTFTLVWPDCTRSSIQAASKKKESSTGSVWPQRSNWSSTLSSLTKPSKQAANCTTATQQRIQTTAAGCLNSTATRCWSTVFYGQKWA